MTHRQDDEQDATRIQAPGVRGFNEQLGRAYMNPYGRPEFSTPGNPPTPPEPPASIAGIPLAEGARRAAEQQPQPAPRRRRLILIAALLGALLLGVLIGIAGDTDLEGNPGLPVPPPSAAPAPTVTVTEPSAKITKEVTPAACVEALEASDKAFRIVSKSFGAVGDAMEAMAQLDVYAIQEATADIKRYRKQLTPVVRKYRVNRADCLAKR